MKGVDAKQVTEHARNERVVRNLQKLGTMIQKAVCDPGSTTHATI
jgi:hypothetical protein